jgi:prephenate dehydrogenase
MTDPAFTDNSPVSLSTLNVGIAGLGLMGGSLALSLAGKCARRIGMDLNPAVGREALDRAIVDESVGSLKELVERADVIVLAAPVRGIVAMLQELVGIALPSGARRIIIDIGSTKQDVVAAMEHLPNGWEPIGVHPICGREVSGIAHADGTLFQSAAFVLCACNRTTPRALALARELAIQLGARPFELTAAQHDKLVAATSHLPHLTAVALALTVGDLPSAELTAGPGLRDASRLAGSGVVMMADILATNQAAVLEILNAYIARLEEMRSMLQAGDENQLRTLFAQARQARADLMVNVLQIKKGNGG